MMLPLPGHRLTSEQSDEMQQLLSRYWGRDQWHSTDPFFDAFRNGSHMRVTKQIAFSRLPAGIKEEVKFFLASRLESRVLGLSTVFYYGPCLERIADFLAASYPAISSLAEFPTEKGLLQWRSFLAENRGKFKKGMQLRSPYYEPYFRQLLVFFSQYYDYRAEFEKDVWDFRRIPGAKVAKTQRIYPIKFESIPPRFRLLVKRYLKIRVERHLSLNQCWQDVHALSLFFDFIEHQHPDWYDLEALSRQDMEDYLAWFGNYGRHWVRQKRRLLIALRGFLDYIQRAEYPEAPKAPLVLLMLRGDIPQDPKDAENKIKYIPEAVLQQLELHLDQLTPARYIPLVLLLRASGWRISDILNLRYDTCLDRTDLGWYLCGDITKTQVLNHRIPITNEVAAVVQAIVEETKGKSAPENNPDKFLFVGTTGKRKGLPPLGEYVSNALNRLAQCYEIVDQQGQVFHFGNHAFRHTKAVELINNGMSLVHVQKWMAHYSPEMTLRYARILDSTMREEWEKVAKQGLFRFDRPGTPTRVQLADLANEDIIEWEYIRTHLDAVRVPLGYCMKPLKLPCGSQLNPCLTCPFLCTTAQFLPEFERHMEDTQAMIDRGKALGRTTWVEKNETTFIRLESITRVLRDSKTHHKVGKQGREYVGEDQHDQ